MLTRTVDLTTDFNNNGSVNIDISNWDYVLVQMESPTGAVTFNATLDANPQTGASDGNALTATPWIAVQGTNLNSGTAETSSSSSRIHRFSVVGHFLQLTGSSVTATKMIIFFAKIS